MDHEKFQISYRVAASYAHHEDEFVTIVFSNCQSFRFTKIRFDLNGLQRHKYFKLHLEHFEAHRIVESDWINEFFRLNPEGTRGNLNHFLLSFKDEILEILADDFQVVQRGKR